MSPEAAAEMADSGEEVDFSFDEGEPEAEISLAAGDAAGGETAAEAPEESFEELDVVASAEEAEEGGLEFDLDDFIVDLDEEK